jgi:transposase
METLRYVGMDIHKDTLVMVVLNGQGKVVMESIIETKALTVLEFFKGLRGRVHITFEEEIHAAWLYDVLHPYVAEVVVCDPRKNRLLLEGNKGDRLCDRRHQPAGAT